MTTTVSRRTLLRASAAGAAALGAGATTGCSGTRSSEELVFGHFGGAEQFRVHAELVKLFRRRFPDIPVRETYADPAGFFAKLPLLFRSGAAPDVFMAAESWISGLADLGGFEDLTPWLARSGLSEDLWLPGSFGAVDVDGARLGMPISVFAKGFAYNASLFEQQGVALPEPGWTEDQWLETARRMTFGEGNDKIWGTRQFTGGGGTPPYDLPTLYGGMIFDYQTREMSCTSSEVERAVQLVADLIRTEQVAPSSAAGAALTNGLPTGRFAMDSFAAYQSQNWADQIGDGFEWGVIPYPVEWRGTYQNNNVAVFAGSQRKEAAWELARFVATDPEAQALLGQFATPTLATAAAEWIADPPEIFTGIDWQPLVDRLPEQGVAYQGGSFNKVWSIFNQENQRVQLQGAPVGEAMAAVDERGTQILGV